MQIKLNDLCLTRWNSLYYLLNIISAFWGWFIKGEYRYIEWSCFISIPECNGSVVECFTWDPGAAGSSLTGVTALCPLSKNINPV